MQIRKAQDDKASSLICRSLAAFGEREERCANSTAMNCKRIEDKGLSSRVIDDMGSIHASRMRIKHLSKA